MTLLLRRSCGAPLKSGRGSMDRTRKRRKWTSKLTHCFDHVAVLTIVWEAIFVDVLERVSTRHKDGHPVVESLFFWQQETTVADMVNRAELLLNTIPAITRLVLPRATDLTEKLASLAVVLLQLDFSQEDNHCSHVTIVQAFAFDYIGWCSSLDFVVFERIVVENSIAGRTPFLNSSDMDK